MGVPEILITAGVVAVLASIAGGGLKGFGIEVPLLASLRRQVALLIVGAGLVGLGLYNAQLQQSDAATARAAADQANAAGPLGGNVAAPATPPPAAAPTPNAEAGARPEVPNIIGLQFASARDFLLQNSWAPVNQGSPMANDNLGLRKDEIFETGYGEAVACSGTGMAFCLFRYQNPRGFVLDVRATGEDLKTAKVDGTKLLDCFEKPKPEGCA